MGKPIPVKLKRVEKIIPSKKTCKLLGINHKRIQIMVTEPVEARRPQTNGKVEYAHYLYDKEFYRKTKFLSFADREEKTKRAISQSPLQDIFFWKEYSPCR